MTASLSVILPVHNAQATLVAAVQQLLDVLPDLTSRFEIWIVDDGSTDQTDDVAYDLKTQYPQIRLAHHPLPRGLASAVQTGMARATGDVLFVIEDQTSISPADLRRLWNMRDDEELIIARAPAQPKPLSTRLMERLSEWGLALQRTAQRRGDVGGVQMVRRQAVDSLRNQPVQEDAIQFVVNDGTQIARTDSERMRPAQPISRQDTIHFVARSKPPVANFLKHLQKLALGE